MSEFPLSLSRWGTLVGVERGRMQGNESRKDNATVLRYGAASGKAQSIR